MSIPLEVPCICSVKGAPLAMPRIPSRRWASLIRGCIIPGRRGLPLQRLQFPSRCRGSPSRCYTYLSRSCAPFPRCLMSLEIVRGLSQNAGHLGGGVHLSQGAGYIPRHSCVSLSGSRDSLRIAGLSMKAPEPPRMPGICLPLMRIFPWRHRVPRSTHWAPFSIRRAVPSRGCAPLEALRTPLERPDASHGMLRICFELLCISLVVVRHHLEILRTCLERQGTRFETLPIFPDIPPF